jgi:hypothetical protein
MAAATIRAIGSESRASGVLAVELSTLSHAKSEGSAFAGDKDFLIATRGTLPAFFLPNRRPRRQNSVDGLGGRLIRMNVSTIEVCSGPKESFTTLILYDDEEGSHARSTGFDLVRGGRSARLSLPAGRELGVESFPLTMICHPRRFRTSAAGFFVGCVKRSEDAPAPRATLLC